MSFDFLVAHLQRLLEVSGILVAILGVILVGGVLLSRFDGIPFHDAVIGTG